MIKKFLIWTILCLFGCSDQSLIDNDRDKALKYTFQIIEAITDKRRANEEYTNTKKQVEAYYNYQENDLAEKLEKYNQALLEVNEYNNTQRLKTNEINAKGKAEIDLFNEQERQRVKSYNEPLIAQYNKEYQKEQKRVSHLNQEIQIKYDAQVKTIKLARDHRIKKQKDSDRKAFSKALKEISKFYYSIIYGYRTLDGFKDNIAYAVSSRYMFEWKVASSPTGDARKKGLNISQVNHEKFQQFKDSLRACFIDDKGRFETCESLKNGLEGVLSKPNLHSEADYVEASNVSFPTLTKIKANYPIKPNYIEPNYKEFPLQIANIRLLPTKPHNPYKNEEHKLEKLLHRKEQTEVEYKQLIKLAAENGLGADWEGFYDSLRTKEEQRKLIMLEKKDLTLFTDSIMSLLKEHG